MTVKLKDEKQEHKVATTLRGLKWPEDRLAYYVMKPMTVADIKAMLRKKTDMLYLALARVLKVKARREDDGEMHVEVDALAEAYEKKYKAPLKTQVFYKASPFSASKLPLYIGDVLLADAKEAVVAVLNDKQ